MPVSTVSSKGQITLPSKLRKKLGIEPKDRVLVESTGDAITIKRIADFFSFQGFAGKALPREEEKRLMMEGVARHVMRKRT